MSKTTNMNRTKKSATAPKKKSSTPAGEAAGESVTSVKCAVCEQTIVEGKEQALYCEGTCIAAKPRFGIRRYYLPSE